MSEPMIQMAVRMAIDPRQIILDPQFESAVGKRLKVEYPGLGVYKAKIISVDAKLAQQGCVDVIIEMPKRYAAALEPEYGGQG